jgi:hypothetical protein
MHSLRRTLLAALFAGGMVALAAVPAGAGQNTPVNVAGVPTCNGATGNYDITWTLTKTNQPSVPVQVTQAIQTPPGTDYVAQVTPNPIPADPGGMGVLQSSTLATTLPGNTAGPAVLSVVAGGNPSAGTIVLDGACTVTAVEVAPDFTG